LQAATEFSRYRHPGVVQVFPTQPNQGVIASALVCVQGILDRLSFLPSVDGKIRIISMIVFLVHAAAPKE